MVGRMCGGLNWTGRGGKGEDCTDTAVFGTPAFGKVDWTKRGRATPREVEMIANGVWRGEACDDRKIHESVSFTNVSQ